MVQEAHRLGKKVVVHARGREAVLYAARASVDLIFHAYFLDDECIQEMLKSGSAIGPTLTFLRNIVDFTQPHEPAATKGRIDDTQEEFEIACENLRKAHKAGVPMLTGTDSGFAVTPYGEWHARELEIFVEHLGFTPAEALRAATEVTARFMADGHKIGVLEKGRAADFIAVDGSPLQNVGDSAGQEPNSRGAYRREADADPEPRLRSAPSYRLCLDELERHLHPGAGRGAPRSETGGGVIGRLGFASIGSTPLLTSGESRCHALFANSPSSDWRSLPCCLSRCGIADAHAQSAQKISLRLDWVTSGYHAPYFVGIKNGYYKEQGLDVTVEPGNGSANVAQAIGNGNGDFATVDGGAMMQLVAKGLPVKSVMGLYQRNPIGVIYNVKSGITKPKDIEGKTLVITNGDAPAALLPAFMRCDWRRPQEGECRQHRSCFQECCRHFRKGRCGRHLQLSGHTDHRSSRRRR